MSVKPAARSCSSPFSRPNSQAKSWRPRLVATGQHREQLDQARKIVDVVADCLFAPTPVMDPLMPAEHFLRRFTYDGTAMNRVIFFSALLGQLYSGGDILQPELKQRARKNRVFFSRCFASTSYLSRLIT